MKFADAHSDFGILRAMVVEGLVSKQVEDDFVRDLEIAEVGLSIVQVGGDFNHETYDFRERDIVLQTMELFQPKNIKMHPYLEVAVSKKDIDDITKRGKSVVILSIEGSAVIDVEFETLDILYKQGLRNLAITHDNQNQYGCGCRVEEDTGLTTDGERLLDYATKKDILLDLVHVGEKTFWDAYEYTKQSVYVSHSNSKSVFDCVRNITDQQIEAIGDRNGIIAVNFISGFISSQEGKVPLTSLIDHIDKIVELTSIENVALGPDFYGYLMPDLKSVGDIEGPADLVKIPPALMERGYSEKDCSKICHENLVRFIKSSM